MSGALLTKRPLAASETYTGGWINRLQEKAVDYVRALVYADQAGTLYLDESDNGGTTSSALVTTSVSAGVATSMASTALTKKWYRFRYVNGATAQTDFLLIKQELTTAEALLTALSGTKSLNDVVSAITTMAGLLGALNATAITDPTASGSEIALLKGLLKQLQGTGGGAAPVSLTGRNFEQSSYIIPMMDLLAWSGFTNQPANDGVEVVSNNAADTGKCTIFGTTHGTGAFAYETVTLTGVTAVKTTKLDWGNIYGIFLGDHEGKNITPAVGTITVREDSADQTITTLAANAISKGMVAFLLTGKNIIINVHSGNVWKRTAGVVTTANGFKMNLTGGNIKEEQIASWLYLISDTTGATAQIEVLA